MGSVGQQQKDKISTKKTGEGGGGGKYPETIIYTHAQLDLTGEQKPVAKIPSFTEHAVSAFCYRKKRSAMIRLLGMRLMTRLLLVVCSLSLISILFLSRCGLNTLEPETEEQDGGQAQSELAGNAISLILSYNPSVSSSDFCGFCRHLRSLNRDIIRGEICSCPNPNRTRLHRLDEQTNRPKKEKHFPSDSFPPPTRKNFT